ncbi:hypothetical protein CH513_15435 [Salmonella enterica subsp. enterica serovar Infantis]|nr:hypothetical protein [Salmonella enterica subsp. enterica serovar Infantis]
MIEYPVYQKEPDNLPESVTRYGIGFPFIHNVYDLVNEFVKSENLVRPKLNDKGERIFHFTYHYDKHKLG